jgi:hypothetical protein
MYSYSELVHFKITMQTLSDTYDGHFWIYERVYNTFRLLFVFFCVLFVCKCVLSPGDNPTAVNKYIMFILFYFKN